MIGCLPFEFRLSDVAPCQGTFWAWIRRGLSGPKGSGQPSKEGVPYITPPRNGRWKVQTSVVVQNPWRKINARECFSELEQRHKDEVHGKASGSEK